MKNVLWQFNVSMMRAPYTDPMWDEWKQLLPKVHDEADADPGFVARDHGEHSPLGYIAPWPTARPLLMGNLSQWRSRDDLFRFTFTGTHRQMMLRRTEWFHPWPEGYHALVMWWAPPGKFDIHEARRKLLKLQLFGPGADVFGWKQS
jgi:hypothetical protein